MLLCWIWHCSRPARSSVFTASGTCNRTARKSSLMPNFFASGVPEYPGIKKEKLMLWRGAKSGLVLRSVVSLAGAHLHTFILRQDCDCAVASVRGKIRRLIGHRVLAAQLLLNRKKRIRHVAHLERKERSATRRICDTLQHLVALTLHAADVRADGVDDHFRARRHIDGFLARHVAQVVLAVAQQNNGAAHRSHLLLLQH